MFGKKKNNYSDDHYVENLIKDIEKDKAEYERLLIETRKKYNEALELLRKARLLYADLGRR